MQPFKISMIFKKSTLEIFIHFLFAEMTQINWPQYKKNIALQKVTNLAGVKTTKTHKFHHFNFLFRFSSKIFR